MAERVDRTTAPEGSGGVFIKPTNSMGIRIRIIDGPVCIRRRFQNDPNEPLRQSFVYKVVALETAPDGKVAMIDGKPILSQGVVEFGPGLQRKIAQFEVDGDFGDVTKYNIKFTVSGEGKKKRYDLSPLQPSPIDPYTDFLKTVEQEIDLDDFATRMETGNWEGSGGSQGQPAGQQTSGQGAAPVDEYDPFAD